MNKLIYTVRMHIVFLLLLECIMYVNTIQMSDTIKGVWLVVVPLMITCISGLLVEQTTRFKSIGKWGIFYGSLLFLINLYDTIQSLC